MRSTRIAIIGAGVAGLSCAIDLARAGLEVVLFERTLEPGGKIRRISVDGNWVDAGPTVFTLRQVFDEIFADAGDALDRRLKLRAAELLARHAWDERGSLDLYADLARSAGSIAAFAGAREAEGFLRFAAQARRIYRTLESTFMRASRPNPLTLARRVGAFAELWNIRPFTSLWRALGGYFRDPRLRQLFGRYATYCGSSPFRSPATLMLIAHAEQAGVWYIEGGMQRLAVELAALAQRRGATLRFGTEIAEIMVARGRVEAVLTAAGEHLAVDAVVCNADVSALAAGSFGRAVTRAVRGTRARERSLSAVTLAVRACVTGFDLAHHNVFFGADYRAEFEDLFRRRRLPRDPTVYACAQDRLDDTPPASRSERLLLLINAPANGDLLPNHDPELESCEKKIVDALSKFGLRIRYRPEAMIKTGPRDFQRLFPHTGGALYGPASHGWMASFTRAGSRTSIQGLYLAGGSTHPGPGLPMAATSGRLAAASLMKDCASTASCRTVAILGGTSTH